MGRRNAVLAGILTMLSCQGQIDAPTDGSDPFAGSLWSPNGMTAVHVGDGGASGDGGDAADAGTDDGGAAQGADAGAPIPTKTGWFAMTQGSAPSPFGDIKAAFDLTHAACTESTVGLCSVKVCPGSDMPKTSDRAGDITIAGLLTGSTTLAFGSGSGGWDYAWEQSPSPALFDPGQTLTFSGAGDEVPAFSTSIVTPGPVTITAPTCTPNCPAIDRSQDFTVMWTGTSEVAAALLSSNAATTTIVRCFFSASPGVVPAAALQMLGRTSDGYSDTVGISAVSRSMAVAGDYAIRVEIYDMHWSASGSFSTD
jgi:hypothetical protein